MKVRGGGRKHEGEEDGVMVAHTCAWFLYRQRLGGAAGGR
jgi:hypothetical protein